MHILLIAPSFPPELCGVGDHTARMGRELSRLGARVDLLIAQPGPTYPGHELDSAVRLQRPDALVRTALQLVRRLQPDLVLLQYAPFTYSRWGLEPLMVRLLSCLRSQVPVVLFVHELFAEWTGGPKARLLSALQALQFATVCRMAAGAVVTSEERLGLARLALGSRRPVSLVPVGTNLPAPDRPAGDALWSHLELTDKTIVAVFGRPRRAKNEHLLAALADRMGPDERLLILGPIDTTRQDLFGRHPQVVLAGVQPAGTVADALLRSTLVVAPYGDGASTRRGSLIAPLVLGCPVLSTRGKNTGSLLADCDGLLLAPPEKAAYLSAVRQLLDDPPALTALRERAKQNIVQFGWPGLMQRLLAFLATLSGR